MSKKIKNIHPGDVLKEEFLIPMNISVYKLAKDLKSIQSIQELNLIQA